MNNNKIEIKKTQMKNSKNGLFSRQDIELVPKGSNKLTFTDVKDYYKVLIDAGFDENDIFISAMGMDKPTTLKTYDGELKPFDDDDYYKDKAYDRSKFDSYFWVMFRLK